MVKPAHVAAVLKQNASGLGIEVLSPILYGSGCRRFYVTDIEEGIRLVQSLPAHHQCTIALLAPAHMQPDHITLMTKHNLSPVLHTCEQIQQWMSKSTQSIFIRVNITHNMIGVDINDILPYAKQLKRLHHITFIAHLPHNEKGRNYNTHALKEFLRLKSLFPNATYSLAATAGVFLGEDFWLDEVRIGVGILGSTSGMSTPIASSLAFPFRLQSVVLGQRNIPAYQCFGYGSAQFDRDTSVVIVGCGLGNGLPSNDCSHGLPSYTPPNDPNKPITPQKNTGVVANINGADYTLIPEGTSLYMSCFQRHPHISASNGDPVILLNSITDAERICAHERIRYVALIQRMSRATIVVEK